MKNWQMQTLLIPLLLRGVVFTKNFTITRREGDRWEEGKDVFKIPTACPTVSTSSESSHCEHFNAKRVDNEQDHCACSCPKDNATFLFHNQTRTCMDNSEVRTLLGCKNMAYFFQEVQQNPLRLLKKEDKERKLHLSSTQNCRENITSSWYIGCDGTRHPLKRNNMILKNYGGFYRLEVGDVEDNLKGRIINLAIQCTKKGTEGGSRASTSETCLLFKLEGTIECPFEDQSLPSTSPTPPISTSVRRSPVETRPVLVTSVPAVLPSTRHAITIKTTPILEALTTESLVERSAIQADSTVSQPRVSSAGIRPTTAVNSVPVGQTDAGREEQGSDRGSLSLGLIIGVCVSSTLVLFIAGFFIYRRRKSSRKSPKSKVAGPTKDTMKLNFRVYAECQPDGSTRNGSVGYANGAYVPEYDKPTQRTKNNMSYSQPNKFPPRPLHGSTKKPVGVGQLSPGHALQEPTYQLFEGPSSDSTGEHERYTCPNVRPASTTNLYQALNSPDGHIYGPGFSEEPVYNVLEDPFQDGTGDPDGYISCQRDPALYNALHEHIPGTSEGHRENDPDSADEPVYNVLEDRNHDGADDESVHAEDPVYNVLKGPNEDGVEGPCNDGPGTTDVPIYSVLEGPDLSSDYDQPSQPTYATVKRRNHRV